MRNTRGQGAFETERIARLVEENLRLLAELRASYGPGGHGAAADLIGGPADVDAMVRSELEGLVQEQLRVLVLNARNRVLDVVMVYQGQVAGINVRLAEVFREAVVRNAPAIIMVHNHPSGDPSPSADDLVQTKAAVEAGKLLGIEVLDHVIIGSAGQFCSLKDKGVMR